jgi:pimeloyl-ACP methyl ester carboxylesterase
MTGAVGAFAPLLLAHGAAGTVRANFGTLLSCFSRPIVAFGPDLPGSGSTPPPAGALDLDDLADRIVAAAGGTSTFAILGYSMGCAVAVRAAIRYPERVSVLALTAGSPRIEDATRAHIAQWRRLVDGDRGELARFLQSVLFSQRFLNTLTDDEQRDLHELLAVSVAPGSQEQLDLVERIDVTGELSRVGVPTLVIGARYDRLVPPSSVRQYADAIPGAHWAALDSGHAVAMEAPRAWARLVEDFVTGR